MDNTSVKLLIGAFIALIVGVALLGTIASEEQGLTTLSGVDNESIDVSAARQVPDGTLLSYNTTYVFHIAKNQSKYGWKRTDCPIEDFQLYQYNGTGVAATLADATDYTFHAVSGNFTLINTNAMTMNNLSNLTAADYRYCPDDYINLGWGRTMLDLTPGFIAIAMLLFAVGMFYAFMRREGLMGV